MRPLVILFLLLPALCFVGFRYQAKNYIQVEKYRKPFLFSILIIMIVSNQYLVPRLYRGEEIFFYCVFVLMLVFAVWGDAVLLCGAGAIVMCDFIVRFQDQFEGWLNSRHLDDSVRATTMRIYQYAPYILVAAAVATAVWRLLFPNSERQSKSVI